MMRRDKVDIVVWQEFLYAVYNINNIGMEA